MNPIVTAALVIIGVLVIGVSVQTKRLENAKAEYAGFVAAVKAKGEEQERKTKERIAKDNAAKEKADADNKTRIASLNSSIKRLRDQHSSSRFVPPAAPGTRSPSVACYGRDRLDSEIRELVGETTQVLGILAADAVSLNTVKEWASSSDLLRRPPAPRTPPSLKLTLTLGNAAAAPVR